jgi:hypothetical protein
MPWFRKKYTLILEGNDRVIEIIQELKIPTNASEMLWLLFFQIVKKEDG